MTRNPNPVQDKYVEKTANAIFDYNSEDGKTVTLSKHEIKQLLREAYDAGRCGSPS